MKFFSSLLVLMLVVSMGSVFALSWNICIDKQTPEAPGDLSASGNVLLTWSADSDLPTSTADCIFGTEYPNIYLGGVLIPSLWPLQVARPAQICARAAHQRSLTTDPQPLPHPGANRRCG